MKQTLMLCLLLFALSVPAAAEEWTAPEVTGEASALMPEESGSFGRDLWYIIRSALGQVMPNLQESLGVCLSVVASLLLLSLLQGFEGHGKAVAQMAAVVLLSCLLLGSAGSMIDLGAETIGKLSEYMKLLLPVLAAALAAQGGATSSASLYTLTAALDAAVSAGVSALLVPMVYVFLVLGIASAAVGDDTVKKLRDGVKTAVSWLLKTVLYGYIGFLSVTGVVSGTADQAAVKAAKLTISGAVPVVGGILSDASETIIVSAGMVKNSVGVYGLTAVIAICIGPFLQIGLQYAVLKATAMVCNLFAEKKTVVLVEDVSSAMGLLLGMTGTVCLMLMISIVCFLKGMT